MSEVRKNEVATVTEHGSINYASDVIAVIAGLAANEVSGIAGMSGSAFADLLGRKNMTKGVKVTIDEESVAIDLAVTVLYGNQIHKLAEEAQQAVARAIENMTGLTVSAVNVNITGIQFEKDNVASLPSETDEDDN